MTLAEHAASIGRRTKGGAEVRLLNIEADAGQGLGLFETLHGSPSPDAFADDMSEAARRCYGSPFRSFLTSLTQDQAGVERRIRASRRDFLQRFVPAESTGEVVRAADRFALIAAGGELATEWGLTGWRKGEATQASRKCFEVWMKGRGTAGPSDLEGAIRQVRAFVGTNGASRFPWLQPNGNAQEADRIINRAGFKRVDPDGETEYLILRETFRNEVCAGFSYQSAAKELDRRGLLVREGKELMIKPRLPELGTTWVYGGRAKIQDTD